MKQSKHWQHLSTELRLDHSEARNRQSWQHFEADLVDPNRNQRGQATQAVQSKQGRVEATPEGLEYFENLERQILTKRGSKVEEEHTDGELEQH